MLAKPRERCSPDCELSGTQNYGGEVAGARYVFQRAAFGSDSCTEREREAVVAYGAMTIRVESR
jgi:hypothetical protein